MHFTTRSKPCLRPTSPGLRFRPDLEWLEDRMVPSAVRLLPGYDDNSLPGTDDGSFKVPIGFKINYFGTEYDELFINNNGNVTFGQANAMFTPAPLHTGNRKILAPFFADVDTRPMAGGEVFFGSVAIDGHAAFVVTWQGVGYYNQHTDKANTFQLVLIDRSDIAAGDFIVEFNYDSIRWETGDVSGGTNGMGGHSAWVGFSGGQLATSFELTGSGQPGSFLDTQTTTGLIHHSLNSTIPGRYVFFSHSGELVSNRAPTLQAISDQTIQEGDALVLTVRASDPDPGQQVTYSLLDSPAGATIDPVTGELHWQPGVGQLPGTYTFRVLARDNGDGQLADEATFQVLVENVPARVELDDPSPLFVAVGRPFTLTGRIIDPGVGGWIATVDFGDGTGVQNLTTNADGSFVLHYTYMAEAAYTITVSVNDLGIASGEDSVSIAALPANSEGKIEAFQRVLLQPGERRTIELASKQLGLALTVDIGRGQSETVLSASVALYSEDPTRTLPQGQFFDIQLGNPSIEQGDSLTLTIQSPLLTRKFAFGYFSPENQWVSLLDNPELAEVQVDARTGTMTVTFKRLDIFPGTVFSISLSTSGTTTSGNVTAPTAAANPGTSSTTSDVNVSLVRPVSFTSSTQLSLGVTGSRDSQLAVSGTAQGSQVTPAISNTASGVGGEEQKDDDSREAAEPVLLLTDEVLLELWMGGIDPSWLLMPLKPDIQPAAGEKIMPAANGSEEEEQQPPEEESGAGDTQAKDVLPKHPQSDPALGGLPIAIGLWAVQRAHVNRLKNLAQRRRGRKGKRKKN